MPLSRHATKCSNLTPCRLDSALYRPSDSHRTPWQHASTSWITPTNLTQNFRWRRQLLMVPERRQKVTNSSCKEPSCLQAASTLTHAAMREWTLMDAATRRGLRSYLVSKVLQGGSLERVVKRELTGELHKKLMCLKCSCLMMGHRISQS